MLSTLKLEVALSLRHSGRNGGERLGAQFEGAELKVLNGAKHTIQRFQPIIMVESVFNNQSILNFFRDIDYVLFSPEAGIIQQVDDMKNLNYFCLHPEIHQDKYIKLQNFIENKVI